jgi:hypothetical protein
MHESGTHPGMWASEEVVASEIEAAKSDWRPLVSYTANLRRIGELLLGTNASWERLSQLSPAGQRGPLMMQMVNWQFPWYWSAAVLIVIFGLSAWILNYSIRSLDRLK